MDIKAIREKLNHTTEPPLFMPNEIFEDLKVSVNANNIPLAYSYYYLISYLYRYAKYDHHLYTSSDIKEILGYNPKSGYGSKSSPMNDLLKKDGILDQIGYTRTEKDFPVYAEYKNANDEGLVFNYYSEPDFREGFKRRNINVGKRYTVKFPVKAFYRTQEDEEDNYENGTFFEIENTHQIPVEVFMFCMSNKELGVKGFYTYCYLQYRNNYCKYYAKKHNLVHRGYDVSLDKLQKELGMTKSTLKRTLDPLKKYNLITCKVNQDFMLGRKEEDRRPLTYLTNPIDEFSFNPITYRKAKLIKSINLDEEEMEKLFGN